MNSILLEYDAFLRSMTQNSNYQCALLLGAGASITSGVQSANDCIWEWKRDIYTSINTKNARYFSNSKLESVRQRIQSWLDLQGDYPALDDPSEYSFYVEKAYPIPSDRTNYFKSLVTDKEPYIGYKLLCLLNKLGIVKSVWTTNFDGLVERAAHSMSITPKAVNLDNYSQIYEQIINNELLYVALHGDYKYSSLKNTENELDNQSSVFKEVLSHYLKNQSLIVLGYSGRDKSLMKMLEEVFSVSGIGKLFWCGYKSEIPTEVEKLINNIRSYNREAYYIPANGFDETLSDWTHLLINSKFPESKALYENIMKSKKGEEKIPSFEIKNYVCHKHIKSNLHPIGFPKELYQFEVTTTEFMNYKQLQNYIKEKNIVAVPYKGKIYSLGSYADIESVFGNYIKGSVQRISITVGDIRQNTQYINLMKMALIQCICSYSGLETNGHSALWKKELSYLSNNSYHIHEGIKIKLYFPNNIDYGYFSFKPYLHIEESNMPKEISVQLNKKYFDKLHNNLYSDLLDSWSFEIFKNQHPLRLFFPSGEKSDFYFSLSKNVAYAGIKVLNNTGYNYYPGRDIDSKQVVLKGVSIEEPKLCFAPSVETSNNMAFDIHPMRGLINNKPFDNYIDNKNVLLSVLCPSESSDKLLSFLHGIYSNWETTVNLDYLLNFPGFQKAFNCSIVIPEKNTSLWHDVTFFANDENDIKQAYFLAQLLKEKILQANSISPNAVIVIFIPNAWDRYKHIENENEIFDLHNNLKAFAAQKGISTQLLEESTLGDPLKCQIYWWLSLSFYVKSLKTPWILEHQDSSTAYAGIGYSVKRTKTNTNIVLGCSHIYNSEGLGLKYRLSNIKENGITFDNKRNPYLSYNEAYKFGMNICELFYESMQNLPKRVVVHKRTEFRKDEINGIVDSLKNAGVDNIDLISINIEKDQKFISMKLKDKNTVPDTFPISRGTCIIINDNQALLWAHGIVPSIRNPKYRYYQGGRSIPSPLLLTHQFGHGDIITLANEILGLTKMNWNSFNMYTKMPATIDSSNQIAIIGGLFSDLNKTTYDYRYFI